MGQASGPGPSRPSPTWHTPWAQSEGGQDRVHAAGQAQACAEGCVCGRGCAATPCGGEDPEDVASACGGGVGDGPAEEVREGAARGTQERLRDQVGELAGGGGQDVA